jgi:hypothetical protein
MVSMNKKIKNSGWLRGYGEHTILFVLELLLFYFCLNES